MVALAVHFGGEAGAGLAGELAVRHPAPRMRVTALRALASRAADRGARVAIFERGLGDPHPYVAGHARALVHP